MVRTKSLQTSYRCSWTYSRSINKCLIISCRANNTLLWAKIRGYLLISATPIRPSMTNINITKISRRPRINCVLSMRNSSTTLFADVSRWGWPRWANIHAHRSALRRLTTMKIFREPVFRTIKPSLLRWRAHQKEPAMFPVSDPWEKWMAKCPWL